MSTPLTFICNPNAKGCKFCYRILVFGSFWISSVTSVRQLRAVRQGFVLRPFLLPIVNNSVSSFPLEPLAWVHRSTPYHLRSDGKRRRQSVRTVLSTGSAPPWTSGCRAIASASGATASSSASGATASSSASGATASSSTTASSSASRSDSGRPTSLIYCAKSNLLVKRDGNFSERL